MEKENEECCPDGEPCEEPEVEEEKTAYVNPLAIPYVQSDHLKELIAKKEKKDKKLKIVQKKR